MNHERGNIYHFGRRLNQETGKYECLCMRCMANIDADSMDDLKIYEDQHQCADVAMPVQDRSC